MKALILNSGMGSRMGVLTADHPKCMTEISSKDTILSRQLRQLAEAGIQEVVMTTGVFDRALVSYCQSLELPLHITFVNNPKPQETNYIYSIYCARIESLILERGMEDALERAFAFVGAGADAVMIHSRKKDPTEIFTFVERFREKDQATPLVVVPTSFNTVTEETFKERGVNVVIYANQLTRTGFPAMQHAAELILENHRAKECDEICMPIKEIIRLIPEDV